MIGTGAAILGAGVLGAGASLFGASQSASAANSAAAAQERAANRATETQLQMYNRTRADLAPFMGIGTGAFNQLAGLYGLPTYAWNPNGSLPSTASPMTGQGRAASLASPGTAQTQGGTWDMTPGTGTPNYSAFMNSPDYKFAFDEGEKALNRSLAAKGQLVSGNALKAATSFGQGMATQQFGNYFNRLMQMSGIGQNAAAGAGNAAMTAGGQIGNSQMAAGQAQASGLVGAANAWNQGLSGVGNAATGGLNQLMMFNAINKMNGGSGGSSYGMGSNGAIGGLY